MFRLPALRNISPMIWSSATSSRLRRVPRRHKIIGAWLLPWADGRRVMRLCTMPRLFIAGDDGCGGCQISSTREGFGIRHHWRGERLRISYCDMRAALFMASPPMGCHSPPSSRWPRLTAARQKVLAHRWHRYRVAPLWHLMMIIDGMMMISWYYIFVSRASLAAFSRNLPPVSVSLLHHTPSPRFSPIFRFIAVYGFGWGYLSLLLCRWLIYAIARHWCLRSDY